MAFLQLNIRGRLIAGFSVLCMLLAVVVGTTIIKVRNAGDSDYFTVATITNPTTDCELWLGSGADFVVVEITGCTDCSISSTISAFVGDKRVI